MKSTTVLGIVLAVLGVLALVYQGFNYTRQKAVIDVGPIHATADERERVSIPPLAGGLVLAAGIALVIVGAKQKG
jgi:drug/metabolite transporter (DMT)-like permease